MPIACGWATIGSCTRSRISSSSSSLWTLGIGAKSIAADAGFDHRRTAPRPRVGAVAEYAVAQGGGRGCALVGLEARSARRRVTPLERCHETASSPPTVANPGPTRSITVSDPTLAHPRRRSTAHPPSPTTAAQSMRPSPKRVDCIDQGSASPCYHQQSESNAFSHHPQSAEPEGHNHQ